MNIILKSNDLILIGENEEGKKNTRNYLCAKDWKVFNNDNKEIGLVTFEREYNKYSIVFQIYKGYEDNGYATLAIKKILEEVLSYNSHLKLIAHVSITNPAAARVLVKNHFTYSGEDDIFEHANSKYEGKNDL